jgi:hypothetical protein
MKHALTLFKAAAIEMLRSRKARVLFQAAFVGSVMAATFAYNDNPEYVSKGIGWALGTGVGQALWEIGTIYNRLRRLPTFSGFNHA